MPIVDERIFADFAEIAAYQREMMMLIHLADIADPLQRGLVADMASERIAGIGRVHDHAARAQELDRLANESRLRRHRMQL